MSVAQQDYSMLLGGASVASSPVSESKRRARRRANARDRVVPVRVVRPESPATSASRDRSSEPEAPCPTPPPPSSYASSPSHLRAQARRRRRVAGNVFRAAGRLAVGMTEMPHLARLDEAADELTVDEFGALAGGSSSAAHPALRHDRCQPFPSSAVFRARVLRLVTSVRATYTSASRTADVPRRQ